MDPTAVAPLGRSDLRVTRVGLGTAPLGGLLRAVDDDTAGAVVQRAWELGIRLFDTAPLYGHGLSERRLGHRLAERPREDYVLSTKVGRLLRAGAPPDLSQYVDGESNWKGVPELNPVRDYSGEGVRRSLEESLERLGLDRVDVVLVHDPDDYQDEALDGAFPALLDLRSQGVVGAVGAGMNQAEALTRFVRESDLDCVLLAGRYTLLDQSGLGELLPLCAERGVGVLAGGVVNSGILADPRGAATFDYQAAPPERVQQALAMEAVCARHNVPLLAAALQFPLAHPAVTAVLLGARDVAELEQDVEAFSCDLPDALWAELRAEGLLPEPVPVPVAS